MPAKPKKAAGSRKRPAKKKCPICGKPATAASKPFCSEHCRDVDLNRWLSDAYVIPGGKDKDEDKE